MQAVRWMVAAALGWMISPALASSCEVVSDLADAPPSHADHACFGTGDHAHSLHGFSTGAGITIIEVHPDLTGVRITDRDRRALFDGRPFVGQVIDLRGLGPVQLEAFSRSAEGCLVRYRIS